MADGRSDLTPCSPPAADAPTISTSSRGAGFTVDPCGRILPDSGKQLPTAAPSDLVSGLSSPSTQVTIDSFTTSTYYYSNQHDADGPITIVGAASLYKLSDGSTWGSGSGFNVAYQVRLDHVEVVGTTVRYFLTPPISGRLYQQTDFDSGSHSAQGTLNAAGQLVLEATIGSGTATLHGEAVIVDNAATAYGEPRFNYYSSVPGSIVPFDTTLTLYNTEVWDETTFARSFYYTTQAQVDFANPVSTPPVESLAITGPSRVASNGDYAYTAAATFAGGGTRNVSAAAAWSVDPFDAASIAAGVLSTGALGVPEEQLTIEASYTNGATVQAQKQVRFLAQDPVETADSWPMFQAGARHTGFVASGVDPTAFALRWQRNLGPGAQISPVVAGGGKVFVSMLGYGTPQAAVFALRASDGTTVWSRDMGAVFRLDPPSVAYGMVYVQAGDGTGPLVYGLDAEDGGELFKVLANSYYYRAYAAPTPADRHLYLAGDGLVRSLDAFSGALDWSKSVATQGDGWTPSVDGSRVWEYATGPAGLWSLARATGDLDVYVPDPSYANSGTLVVAPALGDHDDALVIQGGRLISFDTAVGTIRWQVVGQFAGQPSVYGDRVFAQNGGALEVRDETTDALLWSWSAPEGSIVAPIALTPGFAFVSTSQAVHAVSLASHQEVWSYPVAGRLAIADSTLYVSDSLGTVSAFGVPPPPPATNFYTLTPCRIFDTRETIGPSAGAPALSGLFYRTFPVTGRCGIPPGARSISANVTVINPSTSGRLDLGSAQGEPLLPVMEYVPGLVRANNAFLLLEPGGTLTAFVWDSYGAAVDVAIDVNGYFQ
jgi:hypothetical protein